MSVNWDEYEQDFEAWEVARDEYGETPELPVQETVQGDTENRGEPCDPERNRSARSQREV